MTTEVAILNKSAIALAADSAVTVHGEKIYNSANKLFTLSKFYPVGIMVYGAGSIMSVPWETVIKTYRKKLGETSFDTISEYADHFIEFLTKDKLLFSDGIREAFLEIVAERIYKNIREEVISQAENLEKDINEEELVGFLESKAKEVIDEETQKYQTELPKGCSEEEIDSFVEENKPLIEKVASSTLEQLYDDFMDTATRDKVVKAVGLYLFSDYTVGNVSGIVIAGFGEQELFPKVICLELEGVFSHGAKFRKVEGKSSAQSDDSFQPAIIPFAQQDMIFTYLEGIDQRMAGFIREKVAKLSVEMVTKAHELVADFAPDESEGLRDKLFEHGQSLYQEFLEQTDTYKQEEHTSRVIEIVGILPKDELAEMAETLVNLIAFKRKITRDLETVGGPIDVAIITKGDGFIWTKRKHYFEKDLNPQFFSNYYRK
ncbi:MAG: hypothetical protein NXH96_02640 [Alteromonadaceae bacterium]|nr:hypothetical protein [Alteromonadaceae bacterium]